MRRRLLLLACIAAAPAASAHSGGLPVGPYDLWHHWNLDPWIWAPMLLAHWLYGRGVGRAWAKAGRGRIIAPWRTVCFLGGEVVLVVALISPLDPLGETLLTGHMAQHILLTAVAPPLLVLGLPVQAWIWALPERWRRFGTSSAARACVRLSDILTRPIAAMVLHALAIWVWHAPALFEGALEDEGLHALEHITFLATALMLWTAALRRETQPATGAGIIFVTFMHSGMLGGVLTVAPVALYDWYGGRAQLWGLTALADQQIAGLSMWVLAGGAYLLAFAVLVSRLASPGSGRGPRTGIIRTSTSSRSMK